MRYIEAAEARDFESAWFMEDYFFGDAFTFLAGAALQTKRIGLGTGIVNPYTRTPALIAMSIASIDEISNKRAILGIGAGVPSVMGKITQYASPLQTLRESIHVIRELLSRSSLTYDGKTTFVRDVSLGVCPYFQCFGTWKVPRRKIPIYVAAMGPRMLQLAGEVGDGVLISVGFSPDHLRKAIEQMAIGAARVNRTRGDIDVAAYVKFSPSRDGSLDRDTKEFVASCIAETDSQALRDLYGIDVETCLVVKKACDKGNYGNATKYITKEIANNFGACGTKEECQEILSRYEKAGADILVIVPDPRRNVDLAIETAHEYSQ